MFRTCGMCGRVWETCEQFLEDPEIHLIGLQVMGDLPDANVVVFEHVCGTSVSVLAHRLHDLLGPVADGEWPLALLYGSKDCHGLCIDVGNLDGCDRLCRNAFDRRVTAWIARMVERRRR
jgi:hypothetical protein